MAPIDNGCLGDGENPLPISFALAPGICTKMSIIGTMICGSSSRGSMSTAPKPSNNDAPMIRGVSFESMKACVTFPASPSFLSTLMLPLLLFQTVHPFLSF